MKRSSTVVWQGSGKDGSGQVSMQSGLLKDARFAYATRFSNDEGTNPEELIAAAHASCFSMKLSFMIQEAGFNTEELRTKCTIVFENGSITESQLEVEAKIPQIAGDRFKQIVEQARTDCPVSRALNVNVTLKANLLTSQEQKGQSILFSHILI
ncbi:MAG: OsmC family peroxiredoxin [Bacteroidia bacterium]|nr:OsmC family peroxiredoxin [Bacteroidia bacterium]